MLVRMMAVLFVCFAPLVAMEAAAAGGTDLVALNDSTFRASIAQGVTLVDFYADWCGPCRQMSPVLEALATELRGRVKISKLNIDQNKALATNLNVSSLPTLILFKDGAEVGRLTGYQNKEALRRFIGQ